MGVLSNLRQRYNSETGGSKASVFPGRNEGTRVWREIFGGTNKEESLKQASEIGYGWKPTPGGEWGRSTTATGAAFKRLLQAMRSGAPGGWSDDRYEQTRHFVGIAYIAIHRICMQLRQAEFEVYRKVDEHPDGKVPVKKGDDAYDLVRILEKPNPQDSFGKMMYRLGQQKYLTGSALMWMVPNQLGRPMEMYPIPTAIAVPQAVINAEFPQGYYRIQPVYPYGPFSSYPTPSSAVGAPIPAQWMLRFLYPHPLLRYEGYSPLTGLRLEMDEFEMIGRSRHYSMRRSVNPSAVLNFPDVEGLQPLPRSEIERIHAEWENEFQGPENHGRLIVGMPGGRLDPWGGRPVDMDYQSGWEQLSSYLLGGFGITKPAAGMIEDSSYATLFATLKQLHTITLDPECVAGNTPLITRDGAGTIDSFEGKSVEVWNGKRWSSVVVRKTGSNKQLMRVRFSDGSFLDCTPNHRFSISQTHNREWRQVQAKDLCHRMATETFSIQHTDGEPLLGAYTLGVLFGDGRVKKGISTVELYGQKMKLPVEGTISEEKHDPRCAVPYVHVRCGKQHSDRMNLLRADDEDAWWEMFKFDRKSILEFLAGWFDTDGSDSKRESTGGISLSVSGRFRADMAQLLLTKCGIRSSISRSARAGQVTNYGRRSADLWSIWVADGREIPCYRLETRYGKPPSRRGKFQTVKSIRYLPGTYDVYCFTEPEEHKGVFNNSLTYQCADFASDLTRNLAPFYGDDIVIEIRCKRIDDHDVELAKLNALMAARAVTKNEFRQSLGKTLVHEEWGAEIAGTDPQAEAMAGMQSGGEPGGDGGMDLAGLLTGGQDIAQNEGPGGELRHEPEPGAVSGTRPKPRKIAEGSLGPTKSIRPEVKSFYERIRETLRNGH